MIVYQKARIFDPDSPNSGFSVQFNPNTLEYSASLQPQTQKSTQAQNASGTPQTLEQQQQSSPLWYEQSSTLSVRLFFHSYINDLTFDDVRPKINLIRAFLPTAAAADLSTGTAPKATSPRITFAWGTMIYTGTLDSLQVTYQMFAFDGTPVQAEAAITIRGEDQEVSANSTNQVLNAVSEIDSSQQDDTALFSSVSWLFQ